jgi:hypothetical protein
MLFFTFIHFICGFLKEDASSSHRIASNDRMINEQQIENDME